MEGILAIWQRDITKFFRDKARLFGSFTMPILFLLIFGGGMSGTMESMMAGQLPEGGSDFNYIEFVFPGIVAMTLLMTSVFSALSIIEDKDFGYMKEILVSPVSRVSIAVGKMFGAATIATIQGIMLFALIPLLGLSYDFMSILQVIPFMFLLACALSGLGLLFASVIRSTQGFQMIVNILVLPMVFLSGALFPINNLPTWMEAVVTVNPVTYGVHVMKNVMVDVENTPTQIVEAMGLNLTVFNQEVTVLGAVLFIAGFTLVLILLATQSFKRANA
ncbi:ABC-2 type transport system permease protein [Salsuginibacillus halophilus]|uniref:Transport permease protein n=1 Tax=Salsuginibacillus halophilus TaxID=517424 RepID=A0A2P8HAM5_9BACI|nr:ABC transporter permease [Salsuginibacillus halophilus]PSL43278.1 ABC-2 type transport system permease protein [Salsuginibacillus halophilus]